MRKLRGMPRYDITQVSMCVDSGMSDTKPQNVLCADAACGMPWCGSGFTECTRSGNLIASRMKNTGVL